MGRGKPFPALEHPLPIDEWQDPLFEQPGQTRRAGAIDDPFGESRKEFSAVTELREDNASLTRSMREVHSLCDDAGDVATASLLENWIDETEKRTWFLFECGQRA